MIPLVPAHRRADNGAMGRGRAIPAAASGHPAVTSAAIEILRAGGNAYDAVVAGGFASAVAEPALTSLGGGGFLLSCDKDDNATVFDFFGNTPGMGLAPGERTPEFEPVSVTFGAATQQYFVGLGSVAVPGCLAGYLHVQRTRGRLSLRDVLAPSIRTARDGLVLNNVQAYVHTLLEPILTLTDASRAIFAPGGELLRAGQTMRNEDLASFLEALADEPDDTFHHGAKAQELAERCAQHGGLLTTDDLASYRVVEHEPLVVQLGEQTIMTNGRRSLGGLVIAWCCDVLEDIRDAWEGLGADQRTAVLAPVLRHVQRLRLDHFDTFSRMDERKDNLRIGQLARDFLRQSTGGTTHISVCDGEGTLASMTTTNGEGSGHVVPGTGIMLNNMMGEDDLHPEGFHADPPGKRIWSMMAPTIVRHADGAGIALGSGGSARLASAIMNVLVRTDGGAMSLASSVRAPRVHVERRVLHAEPGLPDETMAILAHDDTLNRWDATDFYFGGVHAVTTEGEAIGDPRREGSGGVV